MGQPKIVLIGAGSAVFARRLVKDLIDMPALQECHLVLVDIDAERLDLVYELGLRLIRENNSTIRLSKHTDYKETLAQADFVITTVASGGTEAWLNDVLIPRKFGYYYAVADTLGPGGMSRAFRTIPIVLDIASEMEKQCPQALLINYNNPMTAICRAVAKYTSIQIIGLCHGLWNTVKRLAPRLGHTADEISAWAAGINHFIWLTELTSRRTGEDLYPRLRERAATHFSEQPVAYDLLNLYGLFPSGGDDHLVEFVPYYTSADTEYGKEFNIELDYVQKTTAYQEREFERLRQLQNTPEARVSDFTGGDAESAAEIIECIVTGRTQIFMANLPNNGKIPNLMDEGIAEIPTMVSAKQISGVQVEPLPHAVTAQLQNCLWEYELVVDAAVKGDKTLALQALLTNPSTNSKKQAQGVLEELLKCHREYMPTFQ